MGTIDTAPSNVCPMNGQLMIRRDSVSPRVRSIFEGSAGIGLADVASPLPTPISKYLPSGVTATAVGYQPVGINPLTTDRFGISTSTTATQLLSALATYSVWPSGAMASASGVLPSGALGNRLVVTVSVTIPRRVSMTVTQLLDAQATKSRSSCGCVTIWFGCSPTGMRATTRKSF